MQPKHPTRTRVVVAGAIAAAMIPLSGCASGTDAPTNLEVDDDAGLLPGLDFNHRRDGGIHHDAGGSSGSSSGGSSSGSSSGGSSSGGSSSGGTSSGGSSSGGSGSGGSSSGGSSGGGTPTGLCTTSTSGSYALSADRGTSWDLAGMLSKGGIPSSSWPVCNATPLKPSGGDDTTQINNTINGCAAGTVVQLGAGTFTMGKGHYIALNKGVVLRGAGAGATILKNPANGPATQSSQSAADPSPIVIVGPGQWVNPDGDARCNGPTSYQTAYMQLLSADGAKGSTSVTVASGSIFKAGQIVLLDETSNGGWQKDVANLSTSVWASPDYAVEWQLHNPPFSADDPIAHRRDGVDVEQLRRRRQRLRRGVLVLPSGPAAERDQGDRLGQREHGDVHVAAPQELPDEQPRRAHDLHRREPARRQRRPRGLTAAGGGDGAVRFENAAYSWAQERRGHHLVRRGRELRELVPRRASRLVHPRRVVGRAGRRRLRDQHLGRRRRSCSSRTTSRSAPTR